MPRCQQFFAKLNRRKVLESDLMSTPLQRCLGTFDLTLLGVGAVIGSGLFVLTGTVARNVAGPAVLISYLIAGLVSLLAALCYAEFAARVPRTGSAYLFTYVTIGEFWGFLIGWNLILEYFVGTAAVSRAFSAYLDGLTGFRMRNLTYEYVTGGPWDIDHLAEYPNFFALFFVFGLSVIVCLGVNVSAKSNAILTVLNLIVIVIVIVVFSLHADVDNWKNEGGFMPFGASGVISGAGICFFAYVGFDVIAMSGEESKTPATSIPLSIVLTLAISTAAYLSVSCVLTLMVPYTEIDPEAAFTSALYDVNMIWAQYVVGIGALCAIFTSALSMLFTAPRCLYAMASDGLLFQFLAKVNPVTNVPIYGVVVSGVFAGILACIFNVEELSEFLSIGTLLAYTIVAACVLVLRYSPSLYQHQGDGDELVEVKRKSREEAKFGTLKETFQCLKFLGNYEPGTVATRATFALTVSCIVLAAFMTFAVDAIGERRIWALLLLIALVLLTLMFLFIIGIHHQNTSLTGFKVPWVPYIPAISIFVNCILMMGLKGITWIRFAVWIAVGILLYFTYSIRHSKAALHTISDTEERSLIEQPQNSSDDIQLPSRPAYNTYDSTEEQRHLPIDRSDNSVQ